MFSISGLDSWKGSLQAALARQKGTLNIAYRAFITDLLTELVLNTPQWSGDLAASWRVRAQGLTIRVGGSDSTPFKSTPIERPAPYFRGDEPALAYALAMNQEVIASIRYNTHVGIINENATGEIINQPVVQEFRLRPGNFIAGDVMAIAHTISKYGGGNIKLSAG